VHSQQLIDSANQFEAGDHSSAFEIPGRHNEPKGNRLRHILLSSPSVLYTLWVEETRTRLNWTSANLPRLLGYETEECLNNPLWWEEHVHPEDRPQVDCQWPRLWAENGLSLDYRFQHKDGSYRWLRDQMRLLRDQAGNPVEVVGSWSDITEHKRLEEQFRQAQKMDVFGRLASGMAHDFNNLLTGIICSSEMILFSLPPQDPAREFLEEIRKTCDRAAVLTGQLLAFSRKQVRVPEMLDLNTVVEEMEKMLGRIIGEDIELSTHFAPDLRPILADPCHLGQVIVNLAVNARDAMPGGGTLRIETANVDLGEEDVQGHPGILPGPFVLLSITDTGCGMDSSTLARIFEPFFTTKGPGRGTGIGLATVQGIIQQSKGFIKVESTPGRGTTFRIYLPEAIEVPRGVRRSTGRTNLSLKRWQTLLLVEDDASIRSLAKIVLGSQGGYDVLEAGSGIEALEICASHQGPIHLVVTDVVMRGMSGRELVAHLAEHHPDMKVLFMSGYTDDAIIRHGVLTHSVPFLAKPFTTEALLAKVQDVLGSSSVAPARSEPRNSPG
jgi:PAS domain S-box-containing protein